MREEELKAETIYTIYNIYILYIMYPKMVITIDQL